jgi:hypothetical protein
VNPRLVYPDPTPTRSVEELETRLAEAERLLRGVARGGHPAGMAALLSDIDGYFKRAASMTGAAP